MTTSPRADEFGTRTLVDFLAKPQGPMKNSAPNSTRGGMHMLRALSPIAACGFLFGCANLPQPTPSTPPVAAPAVCPAPAGLPAPLAAQFEPATDAPLLAKAVGQADKGGLCTGQVFQAKADASVILFRAWNSTNPKSQLGSWWAFDKPEGNIADYRKDYEICYEWTPLDMLVQCRVKPGTKIVVGPGQSMQCSQYVTYSTSPRQQVFIDNAAAALENCTTFNGVFSWQ
jgi:hypothetical protein